MMCGHLQRALAYLSAYGNEDVHLVQVFGSSASIWEISNPSKQQLCQDLLNNNTKMAVTFAVSFSRYSEIITAVPILKPD